MAWKIHSYTISLLQKPLATSPVLCFWCIVIVYQLHNSLWRAMSTKVLWPWQLRHVLTVTSVTYVHSLSHPRSIHSPESRPNRIQQPALHSKNFYLYSISRNKHVLFTTNAYCQWHILFNILKIQSGTKMLRKMHLVCLILEYFPLKPSSLKILPPPKKNNVEGWTEHFCSWLNNTDQGGVGGGAAIMLNSPGGSPVSNKV